MGWGSPGSGTAHMQGEGGGTYGVSRASPSGHPEKWGSYSLSWGSGKNRTRCMASTFTDEAPKECQAAHYCLMTKTT